MPSGAVSSSPAGASSFLREAARFGAVVRAANASRGLPFALAHDPYPLGAHRFAGAFARAVATAPFQRRVLGLGADAARDQSRQLVLALTLAARAQAAKLLLQADARPSAELFEELTREVFDAPLPAALRDAWPAPAVDAPSRWLGTLGAPALAHALRERFDEDWFHNERAADHLGALASAPTFEEGRLDGVDDLPGLARALAREVEQEVA